MNKLKSTRNRQKGLSGPVWLIVAGIFGLIVVSVIRVFPIYLENYTVKSVLESVQGDAKIDPKSKRAIWESLRKRLFINEVRYITRENIKMSRKNGKTTVTIEYETRSPYIGNMFVGAAFSETVVIDR